MLKKCQTELEHTVGCILVYCMVDTCTVSQYNQKFADSTVASISSPPEAAKKAKC